MIFKHLLKPIGTTLFFALFSSTNIANSATLTFDSPSVSTLVGENSFFNGSVNYTPGLWGPGEVLSATLSFRLSDDISSNFPPNFDAPREFFQLTSAKDGVATLGGLPTTPTEVFPNLFTNPPFTDDQVNTATNAGIENPNILPANSGAWYVAADVTSLLNASNTGTLDFSILSPGMFPTITQATDPAALALINFFLTQAGGQPQSEFLVIEDFVFNQARLTVDIPSEVPLPPAVWLFVTGLIGLTSYKRKF